MQLCQMVVQALWINDSPLLQLPHFNKKLVDSFKNKGVEDLSDFIDMEDEDRRALLKLDEEKIQEMADFCNHYPTVSLEFNVKNPETIRKGLNVSVDIKITREGEDFKPFVHAPYFPKV
jgi:pre-mRNA-splicing helicase BRR2